MEEATEYICQVDFTCHPGNFQTDGCVGCLDNQEQGELVTKQVSTAQNKIKKSQILYFITC